MKKKIKPTKLNNDRGRCKHSMFTSSRGGSARNIPMYGDPKPNKTPINKDNSIWGYHGENTACGWVIRVPSIKKSKRVWENFYRLYPNMLEIVNEHKDKAINSIVTITERFGSNYRTEKYELNSARRTLKFKVI